MKIKKTNQISFNLGQSINRKNFGYLTKKQALKFTNVSKKDFNKYFLKSSRLVTKRAGLRTLYSIDSLGMIRMSLDDQ